MKNGMWLKASILAAGMSALSLAGAVAAPMSALAAENVVVTYTQGGQMTAGDIVTVPAEYLKAGKSARLTYQLSWRHALVKNFTAEDLQATGGNISVSKVNNQTKWKVNSIQAGADAYEITVEPVPVERWICDYTGESFADSSYSSYYKFSVDGLMYGKANTYGDFVEAYLVDDTATYEKFTKFLIRSMNEAGAGTVDFVVDCKPFHVFTKEVADTYSTKRNITLTLRYYVGTIGYETTIPAGTNLSQYLDSNGLVSFAYLGSLYPTTVFAQ